MSAAIDLAPDYAIARWQLGFLEFTSGNAAEAEQIWRPLSDLPTDAPLRLFAEGLNRFGRDEFAPAFELLERGISLNTENAFVNSDIQLLMDTAREKLAASSEGAEPSSATHLLLQQYAAKPTKH
jgi:hypothetical protein